MKSKYELIDDFPSSISKSELHLIKTILTGDYIEPCEHFFEPKYDDMDTVEEEVEELVFNEQERVQLFLDAKKYFFKSRRINETKLMKYLKDKYNYDVAKIREFKKDKTKLFYILFAETYNHTENNVSEDFTEAIIAAYKFKDKRDRMMVINETFDFSNFDDKIDSFEEKTKSTDLPIVKTDYYYNKNTNQFIVLLQRDNGRKLIPTFGFRSEDRPLKEDPKIIYEEIYPIKQNAILFNGRDSETEIKTYSSVSSWEDILIKFFTEVIDMDIVPQLSSTSSNVAGEIMENIKQEFEGEENHTESSTLQVEEIVNTEFKSIIDDIESENNDKLSGAESIKDARVTGINIENDETSFEVHMEDGLHSLIDSYNNMAKSISEAISTAQKDDITLFITIPNNTDDDEEITLNNGEWSAKTINSEKTLKVLEEVLE